MDESTLILAPLRGVTIRCFRETFASEIVAEGFSEVVTPFIPALRGLDPLKDRELRRLPSDATFPLRVTPQLIGKDPEALREALEHLRAAGYETADLNCGCPFPMVRNKGRGSGLLRTPKVLEEMLSVGCAVMGPGQFSVKTRLGIDRSDELLALMPLFNSFPLRFLTVHARTSRQMYAGACDWEMFARVQAAARVPILPNGDRATSERPAMVGRAFVRGLGARADAHALLRRYVDASVAELCGDRPVLGRIKELLAYWKDLPAWSRKWNVLKVARSVDELKTII